MNNYTLHRTPKVGQVVRLGLFTGNDWQPTALAKITKVHDSYIEADQMGIHGGNPWIVTCRHYMLESEFQKTK